MTATQRFIEKAEKGGFDLSPHYLFADGTRYDHSGILLKPEAWKAVGKVEGWKASCVGCGARNIKDCPCPDVGGFPPNTDDTWFVNMHRMIDALASGQSVEEYLATIV